MARCASYKNQHIVAVLKEIKKLMEVLGNPDTEEGNKITQRVRISMLCFASSSSWSSKICSHCAIHSAI